MWSHYAEEHKGVVIELRCVPELDSVWGAASPVSYTKSMPCLIDEEFFVAMMSGQRSLEPQELMRKLVYSKAIDWSYEKEWRICGGDGRSKSPFEDIRFWSREIEAIYLGCRMPAGDRQEIADLARQRYPHAGIFTACKSDCAFNLIFAAV